MRIKRIWFKPDCIEWIKRGLKTTTFRKRRHEGVYEIVRGPWHRPKKLGIKIKLKPIEACPFLRVLLNHFRTEGPFETPEDFQKWLLKNGLDYPIIQVGFLHKIEVLEVEA